MTSSPLWRGGGRAFPERREFHTKINKKMYCRHGFQFYPAPWRVKAVFSAIVDSLKVDSPKTAPLAAKLCDEFAICFGDCR